MRSVILAVLLVGGAAFAQTSVKSPLPEHCQPGDLMDSYTHPSYCFDVDKWRSFEQLAELGNKERQVWTMKDAGVTEWFPDCMWPFQDASGRWHCPAETASGRVVGCIPCSSRQQTADCAKWRRSCEARVALMKRAETVEATGEFLKEWERTDRTKNYQRRWICPKGFSVDWLNEDDDGFHAPVCFKPKN